MLPWGELQDTFVAPDLACSRFDLEAVRNTLTEAPTRFSLLNLMSDLMKDSGITSGVGNVVKMKPSK